ncbi:hypothetical protein [Botrimarina sp.]|uniref:alpha/beta hydrolase n=1 Tax=Botrimarina sp. TaxID=2795802 RepID=UPI0032EB3D20
MPHAEARSGMPADWAWRAGCEVAPAPERTATFTPMGFEREYAYPLIVWLHGAGADESSLPEVMRHVSLRNFIAVAPCGRFNLSAGAVETDCWEQTDEAIDAAEEVVADAIEAARSRFCLHPKRVFLAGVGVGGTMAMRVALRQPGWFGGAATLDGPLPRHGRLLCRVNESRRLPLLLSACRDSPAYPERRVGSDLALLHSAGCRVGVRQYPGADDLTTAMLADLNRWAMEIVCGAATRA